MSKHFQISSERMQSYHWLKRDFARLCVVLDALEDGIEGSISVYNINEPDASFKLDPAELFESLDVNLRSTKVMVLNWLKSERIARERGLDALFGLPDASDEEIFGEEEHEQ